jgi:hypothetical protein
MFRKLTIAVAVALSIPALPAFATTVSAANTFDSAMPVGSLPGWRQVFAEGFDTPLAAGGWNNSAYYTSKFRAYGPNWADTSTHGRYTADILSVGNGMLTENIHTPAGGMPQVAALVPKRDDTHTSSFQYGRFSFKMRGSKALINYKTVSMLWPDAGNNKVNGEIDFPEIDLWTSHLRGFCHYTNQTPGPTQQGYYINDSLDFSVFHVYTIEWSPNLVRLILDGVPVKSFTTRIPTVPMHLVMQSETALHGTPTPSPDVNGKVDIAWVAAWAYAP